MRGIPVHGDAESMFLAAQSIALGGGAAVDENPSIPLEPGRGGQLYSKFAAGQSLLEAPSIFAAHALTRRINNPGYRYYLLFFAAMCMTPLVSALAVVLFFMICLKLDYGPGPSLWLTLFFGLCTMAWPYSGTGFSEPLQMLLLCGGFYSALCAAMLKRRVLWAALCGLCLGGMMLTKPVAVILAPFFLLYLAWPAGSSQSATRASRLPGAVSFCMGLVPGAAGMLFYNFIRFGSLWNFGYNSGHDAWFGFSTPQLSGLYGMFFSPGKSLFLFVPVLVASLFFIRDFLTRFPRETFLIFSGFTAWSLFYSRWWAWHGDWCWGPRFLLPFIPLLLLPLGVGLTRFRTWPATGRVALVLLLAFSLWVQVLGVAVSDKEYLYTASRGVHWHPLYINSLAQSRNLGDGLAGPHFIPEFSPVAGHAWLLSQAAGNTRKPPPWSGLTRGYVIPNPAGRPVPDFWHVYLPRRDFFPESASWVFPLRNLAAASCVICSLMLLLCLKGVFRVYGKQACLEQGKTKEEL